MEIEKSCFSQNLLYGKIEKYVSCSVMRFTDKFHLLKVIFIFIVAGEHLDFALVIFSRVSTFQNHFFYSWVYRLIALVQIELTILSATFVNVI